MENSGAALAKSRIHSKAGFLQPPVSGLFSIFSLPSQNTSSASPAHTAPICHISGCPQIHSPPRQKPQGLHKFFRTCQKQCRQKTGLFFPAPAETGPGHILPGPSIMTGSHHRKQQQVHPHPPQRNFIEPGRRLKAGPSATPPPQDTRDSRAFLRYLQKTDPVFFRSGSSRSIAGLTSPIPSTAVKES